MDLFSNILDPKQGFSLTKFNEKFKDGKANFWKIEHLRFPKLFGKAQNNLF